MISDKKRDLFLKYLAKIYSQNPNLPVKEDTIYSELESFKIEDDKSSRIPKNNLVPVQTSLIKKFRNNIFGNNKYLVFENRLEKDDLDFYEEINNGMQIYIATDEKCVYKLCEMLFSFFLDNDIICQAKLNQTLGADCLSVCIPSNKVDLVLNYISTLEQSKEINYQPSNMPNPFLLNIGNTGITKKTDLSYTYIVSLLLKDYFENKRDTSTLDSVSSADFYTFICRVIEDCNSNPFMLNKYSNGHNESFLTIINLLKKNLNGTLTLEELFNCKEVKEEKGLYADIDKEIVLTLISRLEQLSDIKKMHKVVSKYCKTGDIRLFTRKKKIRETIADLYPAKIFKEIIEDIGFNALVEASSETLDKFGYEQLIYAINILLNSKEKALYLGGFTNQNNVRSKLGFVIPRDLLIECIKNKLALEEREFNSSEIAGMLNSYTEEKKSHLVIA